MNDPQLPRPSYKMNRFSVQRSQRWILARKLREKRERKLTSPLFRALRPGLCGLDMSRTSKLSWKLSSSDSLPFRLLVFQTSINSIVSMSSDYFTVAFTKYIKEQFLSEVIELIQKSGNKV
jgi:hypothetical protein